MAKKNEDDVLEKMVEYLNHAKDLLLKDGSVQATVFATHGDGILILPIMNDEDDPIESGLDIIAKVLCAYNIREYYVITESFRLIDNGEKRTLTECVNILYAAKEVRRIVSSTFTRLAGSMEIFFGETAELRTTNVEGTINNLFSLKERFPGLTERDKSYIRLLFPAQSADDLDSDYILH